MAAKITGMEQMKARLLARAHDLQRQIPAALTAEAELIMSRSKVLVPVDTGVLRGSGFVDTPTRAGNTHRIELGYGGAADAYALIVHERLDTAHAAPTQAKYLEQPLQEAAPGLMDRLATRIGFDKS